jgi:hypothetical protein
MVTMTWQPIETAPKDGTVVLLWHNNFHPTIGWYDRGIKLWQEVWEHKWEVGGGQPTQWMPLPDAPK